MRAILFIDDTTDTASEIDAELTQLRYSVEYAADGFQPHARYVRSLAAWSL